jgi:hypothetical protein
MPLEVVREIDNAVTELVKWKSSYFREAQDQQHSTGIENTSKEEWVWSAYPAGLDEPIHRQTLSPVRLALILRFTQLAVYHTKSNWEWFLAILFALTFTWIAKPQLPFRKLHHLTWLLGLVFPLLPSLYTISTLISCYLYLDSWIAPIISHILGDISDREEIHYICLGTWLAMVFDMSMIALYRTRSVIWTVAIGLGLVMVVRITVMLMLGIYLVSVPLDLHRKHYRPPFLLPLMRLSAQQIIFWTNPRFHRLVFAIYHLHVSSSTSSEEVGCKRPYKFSPIPVRNIRLLRILPDNHSAMVSCEFVDIPLEMAKARLYEAVSYVWGDENDRSQILVDGMVLSITTSAYKVIHRRRSRRKERLIWIDQVSINQEDQNEKSTQILMMRRIFEDAFLVTAWLGPSQHAFLVQSFIAELHFLREGRCWSGDEIKFYLLRRYSPLQLSARWTAIADFFRNQWFHRMWIVQEAATANRLHIMYGNVCLDWTYVGRAVAVLFDRPLLDLLPGDGHGTNTDVLTRRPAATGLQNADTMLSLRGDINYSIPLTLLRLLEQCKYFDSKDPRDKIFPLLSFATDNSSRIILPDYTESIPSLYIRTMRYLLEQQDSPLNALDDAGLAFPRAICLPSWVPDWSSVNVPPFSSRKFASGMSRPPSIHFDEDPCVIHLEGMIVDSVNSDDSLSSEYDHSVARPWIDEIIKLKHWFEEVEKLVERKAGPDHSKERAVLDILKTIVAEEFDDSGEKPWADQSKEDYATIHNVFSTVLPLLRQLQEVNREVQPDAESQDTDDLVLKKFPDLAHRINCASSKRKFCVTAARRMALVPDCCKEGDMICIISGAKMPFLLRQKENSSPAVFELVSSCYVNGIMHGEVEIKDIQKLTIF